MQPRELHLFTLHHAMKLPQRPPPASTRLASSLLAGLLATGVWLPCQPPSPALAFTLPTTTSLALAFSKVDTLTPAEAAREAAEAVASAKLERVAAQEAVARAQAESDAFTQRVAAEEQALDVAVAIALAFSPVALAAAVTFRVP